MPLEIMEKHDSFSILHTMAYSTITLQQMNLVHKYPSIYWKTACLSVNAGAINEEDYYNLVEQGIIELSDEDDVRSSSKIQYGKVASAIGDMRGTIEVNQPDINKSRMGFTPDAENNKILYGIKGITRVGDKIIQEIILNRPYTSLENFVEKMLDKDGKKLISKDRIVNLIKAGAFDSIEEGSREDILKKYISMVSDEKKKLNLNNFMMLIRKGLVPSHLEEEIKCYNFTSYIRKSRHNGYYLVDDIAQEYLKERKFDKRIVKVEKDGYQMDAVSDSWWDGVYNGFMDNVRSWITSNHDSLLKSLNKELYNQEYEKYAKGTILDWELESLNFFYSGHPLDGIEFPFECSNFNEIKEGEIIGHWNFNGKTIPKMKLHTIVGTVIDKDRQKSIITLAAKEAVVDIKLFKQKFAHFIQKSQIDGESVDENFFDKGTHLAITGIKRGDMFVPKTYKQTKMKEIMKIILKDGKFEKLKIKE